MRTCSTPLAGGTQTSMGLTAIEGLSVAHPLGLGNMHAAMGAGQDAFGQGLSRSLAFVVATCGTRPGHSPAHPPDGAEHQQKDQQIAHDSKGYEK
ncbi:hypothetical protein SDC9_161715 [bioreactor metagenome]|uniref:Uncharacterized protein n=1 Tax=bioreactor metagenome TaxID=1076179 RepID=A0A645FJ13_9ZZZZ